MSFGDQMGNIASELSRAVMFHRRGDADFLRPSLWRALELIELTIDAQGKGARTRELCRFREVVGAWYCGSEEYRASLEWLARYSLDFALMERK